MCGSKIDLRLICERSRRQPEGNLERIEGVIGLTDRWELLLPHVNLNPQTSHRFQILKRKKHERRRTSSYTKRTAPEITDYLNEWRGEEQEPKHEHAKRPICTKEYDPLTRSRPIPLESLHNTLVHYATRRDSYSIDGRMWRWERASRLRRCQREEERNVCVIETGGPRGTEVGSR